jgi:antitoxin component of RelBE/YafQ-DinJ toxin-antitoxin module
MNIDINQAIYTLLWASMDSNSIPFDEYLDISDIKEKLPELVAEIEQDMQAIIDQAGDRLNELPTTYSASDFAHDFILTSEGHGAGFWDRDLGELGDYLTELCKSYGNYSDKLFELEQLNNE